MSGLDPAELAVLQEHYRRAAEHLAGDHDIHRGGTAGQMTHWHAYAHWLACTLTPDLWPTAGQEAAR